MTADPVAGRPAAVPTPPVQRCHRDTEESGQVLDRPQAIIGGSADRQWFLLLVG
jgi:hypothetical protein